MFVCANCGFKKSELGSNPEYEFRRRANPNEAAHLEGISDWCNQCGALRFFFKSDVDKDPAQDLEEQLPSKKLAKRQENARQAKGHRESSPLRALQRERDVLRQELLASLPAQLPHSCMWQHQKRSASVDRGARRRQQVIPQRSKSLVNESTPRKLQLAKQQTERRGKQGYLTLPAAHDAKGQRNTLEEESHDTDQDLHTPKTPLTVLFNRNQSPSWQDEVQTQVNQLMATKVKNKTETKPYDSILDPIERLNKQEMISKMQELQHNDMKAQLKEKRQQMMEWKRIRRHVDGEYDRLKDELDELKFQADLGMQRKRHSNDRMKGGANITTTQTIEAVQTVKGKTIADALDEKLARMLDTLEESKMGEQEQPQLVSAVDELTESMEQLNVNKVTVLSTVQRASFQGFVHDPPQLLTSRNKMQLMTQREPPLPQFQTLPCPPKDIPQLLQLKRDALLSDQLRPLKTCRLPIRCPDSDCSRMCFMSDFNKHLTHEHPSLAMERITPGQVKTFFMNTCATGLGKCKCNMVYFLKDKFYDKNTTKFADMLPILVMSARFRLTEFYASQSDVKVELLPAQQFGADNEIFLIWLTAVRPEDTQIMATISVWPASKEPMVDYLMVNTNEVLDIHCMPKLENLCENSRILMIPGNAIKRMTNAGSNFLAIQVVVH